MREVPIVLLVSDEYPPYTAHGGIAYKMAHLAHLLGTRGYRVEIIAESDTDEEFVHLDDHGNLVHRVVSRSSYLLKWLGALIPERLRPQLGDLPFALRVLEKTLELTQLWGRQILWIEATNWRSETFLFHLLPPWNEKTIVRIVTPLAEVVLQNGLTRWDKWEKLLQEAIQQVLLRHRFYSNADYRPYFEESVRTRAPFISPAEERVFLLPFDFARVSPRLESRCRPPADGPVRLLMVGRIEPRKGFEEVCAALAKLTPEQRGRVRIIAAGRDIDMGPPHHSYRKTLAEKFPLISEQCIEFLGQVSDRRLRELFQEADGGLMASRSESFGYNLLELLAADLPVITADVGAASEIERRGVRYLGKYNTVDELALLLSDVQPACERYWRDGTRNRARLEEIYRENDDAYIDYVQRFTPPGAVEARASHSRREPGSADLVVAVTNRADDFLPTLDSMLREARRATDAGIPTRVTVVHADADLPEQIYLRRPSLRRDGALGFVAAPASGTAHARNAAIRETSGDLVVLIAEDVQLDQEFVLAHLRAAKAHPSAIGTVGQVRVPESGIDPPSRAVGQIRATGFVETHFDADGEVAALVPLAPNGANMAFRRDAMDRAFGARWFDEVGDPSATIIDPSLGLEIFRRGEHLVFAPEARLRYLAPEPRWRRERPDYRFLHKLFASIPLARMVMPLLHVAKQVHDVPMFHKLPAGLLNMRGYVASRFGAERHRS